MKLRSFVLLSISMSALSRVAPASVIVVDPSGSGFTEIQPAVDAAVDGDTILIRTGAYAGFAVRDKALAIVGDAGSDVRVDGAIRIGMLASGKTITLANLKAYGSSGDSIAGHGLYLSHNTGRVRVEDSHFVGRSSPPDAFAGINGFDAVEIQDCRDVALTRVVALGGSGGVFNGIGNHSSGAGTAAGNSTVTVFDSTLQGGTGLPANPNMVGANGGNGGNGCQLDQAWLFASGSEFVGGDGGLGGAGFGLSMAAGGDGGNGIDLTFSAHAFALDDVLESGLGGGAGNGPDSESGSSGAPHSESFGSVYAVVQGLSRHLMAPTSMIRNTTTAISLSGAPGDSVSLLIARQPGFDYDPASTGNSGVLMLAEPIRAIHVGVLPASGVLSIDLPVITLAPGLDSTLLQLQARFTNIHGDSLLSGPRALVVLGSKF